MKAETDTYVEYEMYCYNTDLVTNYKSRSEFEDALSLCQGMQHRVETRKRLVDEVITRSEWEDFDYYQEVSQEV